MTVLALCIPFAKEHRSSSFGIALALQHESGIEIFAQRLCSLRFGQETLEQVTHVGP